MSVDWPLRKLSDICDFLNNKRIPLKSLDRIKRQGDFPYYGASGVVDHIDDYIFDGIFLLISEDGENLRTRNTPIAFKASGKFWVNNHAHILAEKEDGILDYLEYYFSQLDLSPYITGAVQPKLNKANLDSIEIPVPPIKERLSINQVLNSFTNKIQLNRQTNQTLEHIAQALFKSWFVNFEPTRAKIAAKQAGQDPERAAMSAISGKTVAELDQLDAAQLAQLKTTAALFPDGLVESELGEVPEGWQTARFKQIVEKYIDNRGKTPPTLDKGIPLLEVKHLPDDAIKPDLHTSKYVDESTYESWFRAHLEFEDIIISTVGTIGRICMTPESERVTIAQNLLGMRFNRRKASPYFMYYQMDGYRFRHDIDARLVVTVQASIKRKDLETIDLLVPPVELQNHFERLVKPLVKVQQGNQSENLVEIRDTLLPKLLSGELSPTQAEEV